MTHLPHDDRNVRGVSDYSCDPPQQCSHPHCVDTVGLQRHHLWRRSFLSGAFDWVRFEDGTQVGNVVLLCHEHHQAITENKESIVWNELLRKFYWSGEDWAELLDPQPPVIGLGDSSANRQALEDLEPNHLSPGDTASSGADIQSLSQREFLEHDCDHREVLSGGLEELTEPHRGITEGQECPTCKRRVPHKKKAGSPQSKTVSFRLPIDNASEWDEIIVAAAAHLGVEQSERYWKWKAMERALVIALQGPAESG